MINKKEIKKLDKDDIYSILIELIKLNKENEKFVELKLNNNNEEALAHYKNKIKNFIFQEKINLKEAKKAISDFKKLSNEPRYILEIMLFYVEMGVQLGEESGDIYESFYDSMETMFGSIIKILNNNSSYIDEFKPKLKEIINRSCEGWGHRDILTGIYEGLRSKD